MAGGASVLEDGSVLSRIDQKLHKIEGWLALISGVGVFMLMVLAVYSVGGRNMFNRPMPGYVDWIEQLLPVIAFLGIAYTQRDGGHIRMDIVVGRLNGRVLWAAELITSVVTLILIVLLIWGTWSHFDRAFDMGRPNWSRDSSIDIGIPLWPAKLLVPIAFSVLSLRLLIQIWGYGRALVLGLSEPVSVPMVLSAAEQAADEAAIVSDDDGQEAR
ncbi:TRAP transporter small permease [Alisedimentitalea sp. MJ-SS2]|uniref:TRAP transporter small permease subunit n=1 Tax=Aliisedimentitalea sp. MJ-SS2 TaxID=3049795 RepID=UPI00290942BF|nr:TRAP transporter small permease [Alisedimentitalea sp. MJ-SS2]MDU8928924.1 TRAP transporter small permease [Alisedimentitalea sp. MJ-SS2]